MAPIYMTMDQFAARYAISKTKAEELRRMRGFPQALKIERLVRLPIAEVDEFMIKFFAETNTYVEKNGERSCG